MIPTWVLIILTTIGPVSVPGYTHKLDCMAAALEAVHPLNTMFSVKDAFCVPGPHILNPVG